MISMNILPEITYDKNLVSNEIIGNLDLTIKFQNTFMIQIN